MPTERRLRIPRALDGARLDEALATLVDGPSRAQLQKWVRRGALRRDGRVVLRSNERVQTGQEFVLDVPESAAGVVTPAPQAEAPQWTLIHEDADLLVIDKPAGLLMHPVPRSNDASLCELVGRTHGPLPTTFGPERPGVVHRLDRWTSGVVVMARTDRAMNAMKSAFAERRVQKRYLALVHGRPISQPFACDEPLSPGRGGSDRQWVGQKAGAKSAHTEFAPVETLGDCTLLECRPRTGRRHQIRAHLWSAGLALLGEEIYRTGPKPQLASGVPRAPRQALHAATLGFAHPSTGQELSFESPWPADLQALLDGLRRAHRPG